MDDTKAGAGSKDDPAEVARQGFEALMAGKDHVVAGPLKSKLMGAASLTFEQILEHRACDAPGRAGRDLLLREVGLERMR